MNGYECKVFGANNVELVSATRTEHVPRAARERRPPARAPLAGLLALADTDVAATPLLTPDKVGICFFPPIIVRIDLLLIVWLEIQLGDGMYTSDVASYIFENIYLIYVYFFSHDVFQ